MGYLILSLFFCPGLRLVAAEAHVSDLKSTTRRKCDEPSPVFSAATSGLQTPLALVPLADARASAFVKTMMTENLTAEKATAAARALGPSALKTAATVFGAPDEKAFVASLERMAPEDFSQLRAEMASMGMENAPDAEWAE